MDHGQRASDQAGGDSVGGGLSLSKKLACGDLFRQDTFSLRFQRGRGNAQGNLATQGFRYPPHMSLDSEYSSEGCGPPNLPEGFLTVWGGLRAASFLRK